MPETKDPKSPAASRTIWVGVLTVIAAVFNELAPIAQQFADKEITRTALISAVVMIVLRSITKSPLVFPKK